MPKSTAFDNSFLLHMLNNSAIANVGDATGLPAAATVGSLYLTLHTADPSAGNQSTNEVAYTSYARKAVSRTSGEFSISGAVATLVNNQSFVTGTGGSGTATHWGLGVNGTAASATVLLWSGAISPSIVCGNGVTPQLLAGTIITES